MRTRQLARRRLLGAVVLFALAASGCSLTGGTLGGQEKCWPQSPARAASIWRGILVIDAVSASLATPEGESIPLLPGALTWRIGGDGMGELVSGDRVVARNGNDVTLFGGAGADGYLVVCAVEEIHDS